MRVLGISGSLRRESHNTRLLRASAALLPANAELTILDPELLRAIPPYDDDIQASGASPWAVRALREMVAQSDAVLFATPEYNSSIPGVLKNAIDWASRPPAPPLGGKPVAFVGASPGGFGTIRSQTHLRQVLQFAGALVLPKPVVYLSRAAALFGDDGVLADAKARDQVAAQLIALAGWARRVG